MKLPVDKLVDSAMKKYDVPEWVRPYVYRYIRDNPIGSVRFAISLIDIKRRKGEVSKSEVRLPNGKSFKVESILKLLNLFFYGEDSIAHMEEKWSKETKDHNAEYEKNYSELSEIDAKYARAIKNLAEGLGSKVGEDEKSLGSAFEYISGIEPWEDRLLVTGIALRYSCAKTFGVVFYRVFYPVAPEFMRSFGKVFSNKGRIESWDSEEAARLILRGVIPKEHALELTRESLSRILFSIETNMKLAKELGVEKEVKLLSEISIAYPFHRLTELGINLNVEEEVKRVKSMCSKISK